MSGPHLLNLPPPPLDTPSDFGPGTPNSGISQLSTVANREGERGKIKPYGHAHKYSSASDSSSNTLDAERADRISRLAGLERVATLRGAHQHIAQASGPNQQYQPGYFDNTSNLYRSTVGSASATGSVGGSAPDSTDKMSEDADDGTSSAGLSDDGNVSLVGFGEAASSNQAAFSSTSSKSQAIATSVNARQHRQRSGLSASPMDGVDNSSGCTDTFTASMPTVNVSASVTAQDAPLTSLGGHDQAEMIIRETMHNIDGQTLGDSVQSKNQGKFGFETHLKSKQDK